MANKWQLEKTKHLEISLVEERLRWRLLALGKALLPLERKLVLARLLNLLGLYPHIVSGGLHKL